MTRVKSFLLVVFAVLLARSACNLRVEETSSTVLTTKVASEGKPSVPREPESTPPRVWKFVLVTLLVAVGGLMYGAMFSFFSNFVYIVILFPLAMGYAGGRLVADAIRIGKVRKTYLLVLLSLLLAIPMYGTFHYGGYVALQVQASRDLSKEVPPITGQDSFAISKSSLDSRLEDQTGHSGFAGYMLYTAEEGVSIGRFYRSSRVNLGPILTWLYWTLELGIILWLTIRPGRKQMRSAFCEICGNWSGGERHLGGAPARWQPHVLDLIQQKDLVALGKLLEENAEVPRLEFYLAGCQICNQGPSRLIVRRAAFNSSGNLRFTDMSRTVLLPGEGRRLLDQVAAVRE